MAHAHFDCFSGIAGDMAMGALVDAGASPDELTRGLATLAVSGWDLSFHRVQRGAFAATRAVVVVEGEGHPHRSLKGINEILDASALPERVRSRAGTAFAALARAEAAVHGTTPEKVHFHEVGAIDAIVDIVGTCVALQLLSIDTVSASEQVTGRGTVACRHGKIPIPGPAVAKIWAEAGVTARELPTPRELTTPTGAALLAALTESYGPMPALRISAVGLGAGSSGGSPDEPKGAESRLEEPVGDDELPNVLRVLVGERADAASREDRVVVIEATIDDMSGEMIGGFLRSLYEAGALEAWTAPVGMKDSRPGTIVTALVRDDPAAIAGIEARFFADSTTIGLRRHRVERTVLAREAVTVETAFGPIEGKVSRDASGVVITVKPEFRAVEAAAEEHGAPLRRVWDAAAAALRAAHVDDA